MAETLYSREILKLAMTLGDGEMPSNLDGMAERRSAVCGSRISAGVALESDGRISDLGLVVNACAMGQASAAILLNHAAGHDAGEISDMRGGLYNFLSGKGEMPSLWPELAQLSPAREYPARHGAILLSYDAVLAAIDAAGVYAG